MITKDISSREDILTLLIQFYERVKADDLLGIIFNEVIPLDWDHHIPLIADFWETILLDQPKYKDNAMEKHFVIHQLYPLSKFHFERWLLLFNTTLDEQYTGPVAILAKKRAAGIAQLMQLKMNIQ
jgi:hemoglobin